ncbi:MAG TPA: hypothetical protein VFE51_09445 [Verrucomicrobiae bacterium]|nr:hypothetical protein [Verrucomicrobiae bacterium]
MNLSVALVLVVTAGLAWWLSGYDSKVTGDNAQADYTRRIIRCAITLLLVAVAAGAATGGGRFGGFVFLGLVVPLALTWAGCVSELFARGFHGLIDSPAAGPYDPKEITRDLDRLAALFEQGRNEEAIELSTRLVKAGEASSLAMETMLFRLYDRVFSPERLLLYPGVADAQKLAAEGRTGEAESQLNLLLRKEPGNLGATMSLLQLYCDAARNADKATALVRNLEHSSRLPPFFADYVRHCEHRWLTASSREKSDEGIESLLVQPKYREPKPPPTIKP